MRSCTCPLRVGSGHYPGRVLVHVDRCAWARWFATVNATAARLVEQRRAAGALACWLGYAEVFWWER